MQHSKIKAMNSAAPSSREGNLNTNTSAPTHGTLGAKPIHRNLALTGGGTAGHVWPHFALLNEPSGDLKALMDRNALSVFYFGSRQGMERALVLHNAPNWTYIAISTGKLRRYFSWENFLDILRVFKGFFDAFKALKKHKIHVLFSKGGFVAAPVVWAAWLLRIPVFIHESDVTPALATKLTLPFATKAFICFQETLKLLPSGMQKKVSTLGLPMRAALFDGEKESAHKFFNFATKQDTVLIFGGSLGAEALNRLVARALPEICSFANVIHIVGKGKKFEVTENLSEKYRQYEFLQNEMPLAYALADVAICRAGASSLFELAACRIPMLLVPLGLHQSRGDQIVNAKIFERQGWAQWKSEETLSPEIIAQWLKDALARKTQLRAALDSSPPATAAKLIGNEIAAAFL